MSRPPHRTLCVDCGQRLSRDEWCKECARLPYCTQGIYNHPKVQAAVRQWGDWQRFVKYKYPPTLNLRNDAEMEAWCYWALKCLSKAMSPYEDRGFDHFLVVLDKCPVYDIGYNSDP